MRTCRRGDRAPETKSTVDELLHVGRCCWVNAGRAVTNFLHFLRLAFTLYQVGLDVTVGVESRRVCVGMNVSMSWIMTGRTTERGT